MTSLSTYLNFLIALVFILAIGSNILSITYEIFAYYVKQRAGFLKKAIQDVLNDPLIKDINLTELFYNHPQIDITKKSYRHLPQYISSQNFAQTLTDVICRRYEIKLTKIVHTDVGEGKIVKQAMPVDQLEKFKLAVDDLPYSDLKILLNGFIRNSEQKIDIVLSTIETWFTEYMNRVTGWYKVLVQKRMFILALVLAAIFNFDMFHITHTLLSDKELSAQIANQAEKGHEIKIDTLKSIDQLKQALTTRDALVSSLYEVHAPVGWQDISLEQRNAKNISGFWFWKISGWLICAVALSFGAPFWFDLLSKLVNLRKAGIKPVN